MSARTAFTMIEMLIVLVVVAILTVAALPDRESEIQEEARRAAVVLEADLDYAKSLSIARPDAPIGVKVDLVNNKYWLAPVATPDTPITHPTTRKPYVRQFGAAGPKETKNVEIITIDLGGDSLLKFDSLGGTDQTTTAKIEFESGLAVFATEITSVGSKKTTSKLTTDADKLAAKDARAAERAAAAAALEGAEAASGGAAGGAAGGGV